MSIMHIVGWVTASVLGWVLYLHLAKRSRMFDSLYAHYKGHLMNNPPHWEEKEILYNFHLIQPSILWKKRKRKNYQEGVKATILLFKSTPFKLSMIPSVVKRFGMG